MSRVKLTEYRAKSIILGEGYGGVSVRSDEKIKVPAGKWVAKVDQGVKKRMKQGLVAINVDAKGATKAIGEWQKKGFSQFILEPLFPHDEKEEQYLSLERIREGIRVLHAREGGIDIEAHSEAVKTYVISSQEDVAKVGKASGFPEDFLNKLLEAFNSHYFAFLEINPLIIRGDEVTLLDAAVLVDSAGAFFTKMWGDKDLAKSKTQHEVEETIEKLAATTPAQLALKVLNTNGALFFLFSGGGGSIVIADEAQLQGAGDLIGNYGEYSGGPSREETHLYAREVLKLVLASKARKKALVIAGGVANFTDIKKTFAGIIDALGENADALRKQGVKVFIRRGGPNEKAGLELMRDFLTKEKLLGSIHGSDTVITKAIDDAIKFVK